MNERVEINPEIQRGQPIIKGTRIPIVRLIGGIAGGLSVEEVAREYRVSVDDVQAALAYAAEIIESDVFHPLPTSG